MPLTLRRGCIPHQEISAAGTSFPALLGSAFVCGGEKIVSNRDVTEGDEVLPAHPWYWCGVLCVACC